MNVRKTGPMACLTGAVLLGAWAAAPLPAEETNPYLAIVDRNPFALKEPPVEAPVEIPTETAPPAPSQSIKLTGITSIFDRPKALLTVTEPTGGEPPKNLILSAGEGRDGIDVVSIDFEKDLVVVKTSKGITNVTFAPIETAAAAPAAPPRVPSRRGRPSPRTPQSTAITPGSLDITPAGSPTVIGRNNRRGGGVTLLGNDGAGASPAEAIATSGASTYNAAATAANRLRNIPSRMVRTQQPQPGATDSGQPALSPEQLRMWIEANKMVQPELPWPTTPGATPPVPGGEMDQ